MINSGGKQRASVIVQKIIQVRTIAGSAAPHTMPTSSVESCSCVDSPNTCAKYGEGKIRLNLGSNELNAPDEVVNLSKTNLWKPS